VLGFITRRNIYTIVSELKTQIVRGSYIILLLLWCAQFPHARDAHIVNDDDDNNDDDDEDDDDGEDDNNHKHANYLESNILLLWFLYIYIFFLATPSTKSLHLSPSVYVQCIYCILYTYILC